MLVHTGVPDELGGRGLGGVLVRAALERAVAESLTLVPECPFARSWLEKHPDDAARVTIDWPPAPRLPTVLFLCVHNAGRSQMALGWFNHLAGDRAVAWSGGSEPGNEVNPSAVLAMAEVGIDIAKEFPKPWTDEIVQAADVVVTMGCGDACPFFPGKRYEDWELSDPAGQDVDAVRPIRDEIERLVRELLGSLGVALR